MRPPPSIAATRSRRGAVPGWIPLAILVAGLFFVLRGLERDARSRGVARIDVTRYALHENTRWVHPSWRTDLERVLQRRAELAVDDTLGIEQLVAEVRALPFVAEVGDPQVVWPDGLSLPLRMHEPVACLKVDGRDFLPVSADGTVLPGYTREPHPAYGAWLPVLRADDGAAPGVSLLPGDQLAGPALLAALDVARSMWFHLSPEEVRMLGPFVIDATRDRAPTERALPGGVVLDLEGRRRILFGRPPLPVEPGELPLAQKWAHVRAGLTRQYESIARTGQPAWDVLDVRFDELFQATRAEWEARGGQR